MILLAHMIFGAAIGSMTSNIPLALFGALASHYFLDLFPHIEYLHSTENSVKKMQSKDIKKFLPDMARVLVDFSLGILVIFIFSSGQPILYLCALVAIIPDALTVVTLLFPNKLLLFHHQFHTQKVHYLTKKKHFPVFWRIITQVIIVIISIAILR
ncbi:MAG: hypothetical protein Q7S10_02120 [bacterium]|nr:hypothetical protein [bacterium]